MGRGKGGKGGVGWTQQGGRRSSSGGMKPLGGYISGGMTPIGGMLPEGGGRISKRQTSTRVHDAKGKPNHQKNGGQKKGFNGAR